MTKPENLGDLALAFVALHDYVSATEDPRVAPHRLVDLAVKSVPGCDYAAITVWPARRPPHSMAFSDEVARHADQLQYDIGDGPCLSAASNGDPAHLSDLTDRRDAEQWPQFAAAALAQTPIRGVQSFHLLSEPSPSALNLYSTRAGAFDADSVTVAAIFAAHARVLLLHNASNTQNLELTRALATSRLIGAAIGIVMKLYDIDSDRAFQVLTRASQTLNQKLTAVAREVTATGALPDLTRPDK